MIEFDPGFETGDVNSRISFARKRCMRRTFLSHGIGHYWSSSLSQHLSLAVWTIGLHPNPATADVNLSNDAFFHASSSELIETA